MVILAILLASLAAIAIVVDNEHHAQREATAAWAGRAATSIEDEVAAAGAVLTATRGLFAASHTVDAQEFARFAAVELDGSSLQSLNWAERVTPDERGRFERGLGRRIIDGRSSGRIGVARGRAEYFPLTFSAPATLLSRLGTGVDVVSDPGLAASLGGARDGGRPVVTPSLVVDESGTVRSVALIAAVYGPDFQPTSVAARRAGLRGYIGGFFDLAEMAQSARAILPVGSRLQIINEGEPVFDSHTGSAISPTGGAHVRGTRWSVRVGLDQGSLVWRLPVFLIAGGSLAMTLLLAVLFAQANQRQRERIAAQELLRHEADTDGLTGLANRRRLERDLAEAFSPEGAPVPHALMLFDLNGFKNYNDRFGHPAGDALLTRLSAALAEAVPEGRAYRLGGDEFCVLAPIGPIALMDVVPAALDALSESGDGFEVTAAHGFALIPEDATTPNAAMLVADHRMYAHKTLGSRSAGNQGADVLLRALAERAPRMEDRAADLANLADRVALRLGLDEAARGPVRGAARLHDVGMIAIPDSMLDADGHLDADESDIVARHTLVGERILQAAPSLEPIAPLVRSSHERWDGSGYPDGLAGEQIPLASRIVGACEAFETMTGRSGRVSPRTALDELRRRAGTEFDPAVVEALVEVVGGDARGATRVSPRADPGAPSGRSGPRSGGC